LFPSTIIILDERYHVQFITYSVFQIRYGLNWNTNNKLGIGIEGIVVVEEAFESRAQEFQSLMTQ